FGHARRPWCADLERGVGLARRQLSQRHRQLARPAFQGVAHRRALRPIFSSDRRGREAAGSSSKSRLTLLDMTARKLRWGILSTGKIARAFARSLAVSDSGELLAVASRSADSAASFAAEFAVPRAHGSY